MNKRLKTLFLIAQISVIVFAVLITLVRWSADSLDDYQVDVEEWFQEQGVYSEINHLSMRIDGLSPEFYINGLDIKDQNHQPLISIKSATLSLNLIESLIKQQLVVDKAAFLLDKATIDLMLLETTSATNGSYQIPKVLAQSLTALNQFSLKVNQIDVIDKQKNIHSIYNSSLTLINKRDKKQVKIRSSLFQQKSNLLSGHFLIDVDALLKKSVLVGTGFWDLTIPSLEHANLPKQYALAGDLKWQNWVEFNGFSGQLIAHVKAKELSVTHQQKTHQLEMDSVFKTELNVDSFMLSLENQHFNLNGSDLSALKLLIQSDISSDGLDHILVKLDQINMDELEPLMPLIPELKKYSKQAKKLSVKGQIDELFVTIPSIEKWAQSSLLLSAQQVRWNAYKGMPAVNQVDINVVANSQHFNVKVNSNAATILLDSIYSKPFKLDGLSTDVNGQINKNSLLIEIPTLKLTANEGSVMGRINLAFEHKSSPYMFADLKAANLNIKALEQFLPQKSLDEDVLQWIVTSIKQANIATADIFYSGLLKNGVNFDGNNKGLFVADLNLKNIDLLYEKEWPSIAGKQLQVTFKNNRLDVHSAALTSLGLDVKDLHFSIADLSEANATVSLKLNDTLAKQWNFLSQSPLNQDVPYFNDVENVAGNAKTSIQASFPLSALNTTGVLFNVDIETTAVGFSINQLDVLLSDVSSDINITQNGVNIKPAKAKWHGEDITFKVKTPADKKIYISAKGKNINVHSLLHNLPKEASKHISGNSDWDVNVVINQQENNEPLMTIRAFSNLKGTSIHLPQPFSVDDEIVKKLNIELDLYKGDVIDVSLNLDDGVDAHLKLVKHSDEQYIIESSNIELGGFKADKQLSNGLNLSGSIDELNLDHWMAYLDTEKSAQSNKMLPNISAIDLNINELIAYGIEAKNIRLKAKSVETGLKGSIASSVAAGSFFVPVKQTDDVSIDLDMDFVDVVLKESAERSDKVEYTTDFIPNINFNSKKLGVNGKHFTDATIIIKSHRNNYFDLKTLSLTHNKIELKASGSWFYNAVTKKHTSRFSVDLEGEEFGESLLELGMGDGIEKGKVDMSGELIWENPFWDMNIDKAQGQIAFSLEDGYLKDVEPGGGRFVGLLSLSALPRRLTLDFSDIFKDGLEFDSINGNFSIRDGSMWTDKLRMKGSVADVTIKGRTGLKAKDYDQILTVIPQVRDALPVLGSLISGSSVGWAMLLLQRVFKDPIDESVSIKYKVTGTWDDPQITVLKPPPVENYEVELEDDEL